MTVSLINKHILLGVTGSIAAYKSADLVRRLRDAGAIVRVAMTENAKRFITPLTMQAVSGYPVHDDLFDAEAEAAMGHIALARWADLVLIAPATADCMARLAKGNADDLLTTLCIATRSPVAIAPAMNQGMWQDTMTQENLQVLREKGIHIIGPAAGHQACGDVGYGRMLEPINIIEDISNLFATGVLAGLRVMVTAGPTHEAIDPVRYITNGSSGKMGYALAEAAQEAGAEVILISGPVSIAAPPRVTCQHVISAQDMHEAVMRNITKCDIFLAVAAVGDYRCQTIAEHKIHKQAQMLALPLERNPDIVASVGALTQRPFIVGFAAETEAVLAQAQAKRERKKMDLIVANRVGHGVGMGSDENEVTLLGQEIEIALPKGSKSQLARSLIEIIAKRYEQSKCNLENIGKENEQPTPTARQNSAA